MEKEYMCWKNVINWKRKCMQSTLIVKAALFESTRVETSVWNKTLASTKVSSEFAVYIRGGGLKTWVGKSSAHVASKDLSKKDNVSLAFPRKTLYFRIWDLPPSSCRKIIKLTWMVHCFSLLNKKICAP